MVKTVLLIEDDEYIRDALKELLETEGYAVYSAENGETGLKTLKEISNRPLLILLDLMMPIKDGFQFREEQTSDKELSNVPVVIMSADGNIKTKQQIIGAKAYLRKPVDIELVLDTVEKYCS